jgi:hypothetical protein
MPNDPIDPPRKFYGLKPRTFDAVNGPPGAAPAEPLAPCPDPGIAPTAAGPITVEALNHAAAGQLPALGINGPVNHANEVHDILELNRRRAAASGEFTLKEQPPRHSRRKRDFWLLVLLANLFCVGFTAAVSRFSPIVMLYGFACGVFMTAALVWIMWFVMDDY